MSKLLDDVKKALDNSAIKIVGVLQQNLCDSKFRHHAINFYIAPKDGIYDVKALQIILESLVFCVKRSHIQWCFNNWGREMIFGKVLFEECIGTENIRRETIITDECVPLPENFIAGKQVIEYTENIMLKITLHLFPDAKIAADAIRDKNIIFNEHNGILRRKLLKYQYSNFFARIIGHFSNTLFELARFFSR